MLRLSTLTLLTLVSLVPLARAQSPSLDDLAFETVRVATFNVSLNRQASGQLITNLSSPGDAQASAVAEILQRVRPDIVLLNEFDYDAGGVAAANFQQNYLAMSQGGADPIAYPFVYAAPSNTGINSGFDLNNDGMTGGPDDAFGFGFFPGQFGMLLLSRFPIETAGIRTFQTFLWRDMPGARLPDDATTPTPADWYSAAELDVVRLSSKSHWDIPVRVHGRTLHVLCAHPTPPVFDGPEDRNGLRNADEIRFFADYVTPGNDGYIYDDLGRTGGLQPGAAFVICGDYNSDPADGDSLPGAMDQILSLPQVNTSFVPRAGGGAEAAELQGQANASHQTNALMDTADFADGAPGNLRVDYVLPSQNIHIVDSGVFWPLSSDPLFRLTGPGFPFVSSDHRLVWVDCRPRNLGVEWLGEDTFPTGLQFQGTELGGLSGLSYAPEFGLYVALSDDRGTINPARFYILQIDLADGRLDSGDVQFLATLPLTNRQGLLFAPNELDPEGIVYTPFDTLFISSEGDPGRGFQPFVNAFSYSGREFGAFRIPNRYRVGTPGFGVRNNLAFESLTATPQFDALFTATENALLQDGPAASLEQGSACRILAFRANAQGAADEYVYPTEPIAFPSAPSGTFATNGLVELLILEGTGAANDTQFLAMERSFSIGRGNEVKVFLCDFRGADDVSALDRLDAVLPGIRPVRKELLFDVRTYGINPDNLEGMAFGPPLADGRRVLYLVSDNNFNAVDQLTQFLAFALPAGL